MIPLFAQGRSTTKSHLTARDLSVLAGAFAYGFLIYSIVGPGLIDYGNYLVYGEFSEEILSRRARDGVLNLLFNEPIWLVINVVLGEFLPPQEVVRTLSVASGAVVSFLTFNFTKRDWLFAVVILIFPIILKNHLIHLRQGVAVAFFLAGLMAERRTRGVLLMAVAPFVHVSFFFVFFIWAALETLKTLRFSVGFRVAILFVAFAFVSLSIPIIADLIGARQAGQYAGGADVSGLGLLFWFAVFCVFVAEGWQFVKNQGFALAILVFYFGSYGISGVAGRVLESAVLLVLFAGLALTGIRRQAFFALVVFYFAYSWWTRLDLPGLGFSVA